MGNDELAARLDVLRGQLEEAVRAGDAGTVSRLCEVGVGLTISGFRDMQAQMELDTEQETIVGVQAECLPGQRPLRFIGSPEQRSKGELQRCVALTTARTLYLDWNVIESFHRGKLDRLLNCVQRCQGRGLVAPFSADHVREASNLANAPTEARDGLLADNLAFLADLTCSQYLYHAADTIGYFKLLSRTPLDVLATLHEAHLPYLAEVEDVFLRFASAAIVDGLRRAWGLKPEVLSSLVPEDVVEYIDRQMVANSTSGNAVGSFRGLLALARKCRPNELGFDLTNELAGCFKLLDSFGYRPEQRGKERAAFLDSSHAGLGSFTDCLITGDKRFRDKTRVAYGVFGVTTAVLDAAAADEFAGQWR